QPPMLLDEMRDHLAVGFRAEAVPLDGQTPAQLAVVLDDPVVYDRKPRRAIQVRMGVRFRWAPVRRPARVRQPERPAQPFEGQQILEPRDLAYCLARPELIPVDGDDAGRVVAAVLQTTQRGEQERNRVSATRVPDDPAHGYGASLRAPRRRDERPP